MSGTLSTEDTILSNIPGMEDDTAATTNEQQTSTQAEDSGKETQQTTQQPVVGSEPNTNSQSSGDNKSTQQPGIKVRKHDGLIEAPNPNNPNTRDLVDPVTGRIVARGGIERRIYEESQRNARELATIKQQLQQATTQIRGGDETSRIARELNIPQEGAVAAIRVYSDFMRDPVKTLEYLVAEVKAKGYNIPFLEQGINPGMDMQAVQRMLDNKLAPITQQQQHEQQIMQQRQAAEQHLNTFLNETPDAESNLDVLHELITQDGSLSLHAAYVKMAQWAIEQGLDYTQPLKAQIAAMAAQQTKQQPSNQPQTTAVIQPPLPGPRSASASTNQPVNDGVFSESSSWQDIIKASMREAGMSI